MITTPKEYWSLLYRIQDENHLSSTVGMEPPIQIPEDEPLLNINLNNRTIDAPKFLSVQYEHNAEVLFFCVDRYFDNVDLTTTTCIIQYINANGKSRIYAVPFYDTITKAAEDKIIFPWAIHGTATEKDGPVQYSVRFYRIDLENSVFEYNLNTQPATSQVLYGMNVSTREEDYVSDSFEEKVWQEINNLKKDFNLYWLEISE